MKLIVSALLGSMMIIGSATAAVAEEAKPGSPILPGQSQGDNKQTPGQPEQKDSGSKDEQAQQPAIPQPVPAPGK